MNGTSCLESPQHQGHDQLSAPKDYQVTLSDVLNLRTNRSESPAQSGISSAKVRTSRSTKSECLQSVHRYLHVLTFPVILRESQHAKHSQPDFRNHKDRCCLTRLRHHHQPFGIDTEATSSAFRACTRRFRRCSTFIGRHPQITPVLRWLGRHWHYPSIDHDW